MNVTQWIIFILLVQVIHFLGTWKLYVKAGRKSWEALIPVYNAIVLMQIINRPKWWVILLFIPIINLLMFPVIWVETIRSFGRNSLKETWLVILTLGFYIYYVNYALNVSYIEDRSLHPRTATGEWVSSIVFAVVAATLVHTYFIQPYVIPTGSLEKTLLIGDFLLVSKFHYGARTPMTTIAAPMVHDTLPLIKVKSYLNKPQLPYFRLPGFQNIKRNDLVVFSWPADTVRRFFKAEKGVIKPIDKKSNYVKRCVAVPGDSLSIVGGEIFINGEKSKLPYRAKRQLTYDVYSSKGVSSKVLLKYGLTEFDRKYIANSLNPSQQNALIKSKIGAYQNSRGEIELLAGYRGISPNLIKSNGLSLSEITERKRIVYLTNEQAAILGKDPTIDSVVKKLKSKNLWDRRIFPQNSDYPWNEDFLGPLYIPQKGKTIALNLGVLPLYKKIIRDYENNTIEVSGNQISLNGKPTDSYTFKQDYYWMMGDNHHRSEDAKYWGYVPENHIVGKPVFIWMSIEGINDGFSNWRPRWDRFFTTVSGDGEPRSYFKYFLILLAAWFAFDYFRKRRKKG